MGQGQSGPPPSREQLSNRLTQTFATQCYTPLELYCFKEVFRSLANHTSDVKYWSESTLCRFLELPDSLGVGQVIFQLASHVGAFPFPSEGPAILTNDALLRVVTVLTGRYAKVLDAKGGAAKVLWRREIWRGCAVHENLYKNPTSRGSVSASLEESGNEDADSEAEDDGLISSAFEFMKTENAFKLAEQNNMRFAMIPSDNFLRLLQLLLLIAPLTPQDSVSEIAASLDTKRTNRLRETANCMLASFGVEKAPGIGSKTMEKVTSSTMPYLFEGIQNLFEHFLFVQNFDPSKRKTSTPSISTKHLPAPEPPLTSEGEILDLALLNQLSTFLGGNALFRRLQPLYSSSNHGFSMGGFEKAVFNWRAPSILLVSGTILSDRDSSSRARAFTASLPYKRFPSSLSPSSSEVKQSTRVLYGAYIPVPWKQSPKSCFGTSATQLFQLSPNHDVFTASPVDSSYVYFNRPPSANTGLGFGSPMPTRTAVSSSHPIRRQSTLDHVLPLSPVSLHIDDGLEFGVFTHDSSGGGSFLPSNLPIRRGVNWQDRFEIDAMEVWGCGGSEEADEQRKRWAWEEREAEARRRINFGTGDINADKELLRMAGIIGQGNSGGSMS